MCVCECVHLGVCACLYVCVCVCVGPAWELAPELWVVGTDGAWLCGAPYSPNLPSDPSSLPTCREHIIPS